jgi:cytochrome oxidase assembly protein ShyY1
VSLDGRFDNSKEAYVLHHGVHGAPVYHVLTPFMLDDGRVFLVDRGLVPPALRAPATRGRRSWKASATSRASGARRMRRARSRRSRIWLIASGIRAT